MYQCWMILVLAWQSNENERKAAKRRKQLRLLQIREQSKQNAKNIRIAVEKEKQRLFHAVKCKTESLHSKLKEEEKEAAQFQYSECLKSIGESHKYAISQNFLLDEKNNKLKTDSKIAEIRGKTAFLSLQKEKKHAKTKAEILQERRQHLLKQEKIHSKAVASLPPPPRNPIDELTLTNSRKERINELPKLSSSEHVLLKQLGAQAMSLVITNDKGISNDTQINAADSGFNENTYYDSKSEYTFGYTSMTDSSYFECQKENYCSFDHVTKRKPRKSGFVPDVKFRVFNGHKMKRRKKSVNRKSLSNGNTDLHKSKDQKFSAYSLNSSQNNFASDIVRVEKLRPLQGLDAFDLANCVSETMQQVLSVQENKKDDFARKSKSRYKTALKELQSKKNYEEFLEELEEVEKLRRLKNKKEWAQTNKMGMFANDNDVQLKMERIVGNILQNGDEDENKLIIRTTPSPLLVSSPQPLYSWNSQHSCNKKKAYFPPFQQSPPVNVEESYSEYEKGNSIYETPTSTVPKEMSYFKQKGVEKNEKMANLFSPISVPKTSTPELTSKDSPFNSFENIAHNALNENKASPALEEIHWKNESNDCSLDYSIESNSNSCRKIIKEFLSKRGLFGPNAISSSPEIDEDTDEDSSKKAFYKRKFFVDPTATRQSPNEHQFSLRSIHSTEESYSQALSEAARDLEISETKIKICQKEKEKIEEEQELLKEQLLKLRKSMSPKSLCENNGSQQDSPTELSIFLKQLNQENKSDVDVSPLFKNHWKFREGGCRSRPPIMFKRGMDVTPFELSTIYEGDTPNTCRSSVEVIDSKYYSQHQMNNFSDEYFTPLNDTNFKTEVWKNKHKSDVSQREDPLVSVKNDIDQISRDSVINDTKHSFKQSLEMRERNFNDHENTWNQLSAERGITDQSCVTLNDTELSSIIRSPSIYSHVLSPLTKWKASHGSPCNNPSTKSDDQRSVTDSLLSFEMHELSACVSEHDTP